jgi:hypothetical protein
MSDVLSSLQITVWYKAVMAVSAACLVVAIPAGRDAVAIMAFGGFLIGCGEWKNHRKAVSFQRASAGIAKVTDMERKATFFGGSLVVVGALVFVYGLLRAFDVDVSALLSRLAEIINSFWPRKK